MWKHPPNLFPGHTVIPYVAPRFLFIFHGPLCPATPSVLSFGYGSPDEVFHLMAVFLGLILHSCVCVKLRSPAAIFYFSKGQDGFMSFIICFYNRGNTAFW